MRPRSTRTDSNVASEAAAGCSLHAKDPCNACIAQNCCTEFDACISNSTCKAGLVKYAFCLGNNFTSDAGASCDEDFLSSAGAESASLAQCAFIDHCQSACKDQTIGDLCFTYCNCMDDVCPTFTFDGGTCADICSKFDPNQLVCRPYHCNLATQNRLTRRSACFTAATPPETSPATRLLGPSFPSGRPCA